MRSQGFVHALLDNEPFPLLSHDAWVFQNGSVIETTYKASGPETDDFIDPVWKV